MLTTPLPNSDPSGALNFNGKAVLHASGVDFSNGASFKINMAQLQLEDELGKGAYGTVKRVLHIPTKVQMAMKVRASRSDLCTHVRDPPPSLPLARRKSASSWTTPS